MRSDQSFIDGTELKKDLRRLSEEWDSLSQEEKICYHYERGNAPPENENCKIFQLWKKHRNKINKPYPPEIFDMKVHDVRNPEKIMSFRDVLNSLMKESDEAVPLTSSEMSELKVKDTQDDPAKFAIVSTKKSKSRLLKMMPQVTPADLDKVDQI